MMNVFGVMGLVAGVLLVSILTCFGWLGMVLMAVK